MAKRKLKQANSASQREPRVEERSHTPSTATDGPPAWIVAGLLAFLIAVVFGPAIATPMLFDDVPSVEKNDSIKKIWPLIGSTEPGPLNPPAELPVSGRPLVNLSFALNYWMSGTNPVSYHAVNFVLHFCGAMLLWDGMRRALRLAYFQGEFENSAGWLALCVALLWTLHPLQTEAVVYITQRTEVMMGVAYLATIYCSLRYWECTPAGELIAAELAPRGEAANSRSPWVVLAGAACLAGVASKEVIVSAPVIVLLFERTFVAGSVLGAIKRSWPLYAMLFATWIPLLLLNLDSPHRDAAGFSQGVSAVTYWMTESHVFFIYLKLVLWPAPLLIRYGLPYLTTMQEAWVYVVPLAVIGLAALVALARNWPIGFLGAWYFAILSPTFLIPIITELVGERRMYLALAPLAIAVVIGGYRLVVRAQRAGAIRAGGAGARSALRVVGVATVLLVVVYSVASASRVVAYENALTLWLQVKDAYPKDPMTRRTVGAYLEYAGYDEAAMGEYREAFHYDPNETHSRYLLATLLSKHGAYQEAVEHYAEAARVFSKKPDFQNNLGFALYMAGRNDEAIKAYDETIRLDKNHWAAYKNRATALRKANRISEAIESFQSALQLNPQAIEIYRDLASCYLATNDAAKSKEMLERGRELALAKGDVELARKFAAALETQSAQQQRKVEDEAAPPAAAPKP